MFDLSDRITWFVILAVIIGAIVISQNDQHNSDARTLIFAADKRGDCQQVRELRAHFDYHHRLDHVSNVYRPNCR